MFKKTILMCLLLLWAFPGTVAGDVPAPPQPSEQESSENLETLFDPAQGAGELRTIKEQIQSLLKENQTLTSELAPLEEEYLDVQGKVQRSQAQVATLEAERSRQQKELERKMQGEGGNQDLLQLQLYNLQYQKKELELELRLREIALRQKREAQDHQLAEWKKELDQNSEEQKQLTAALEEFKKQNMPAACEIELLKQEVSALENQAKSPQAGTTAVPAQGLESSVQSSGPAAALWQEVRQKENAKVLLEQKIEQLEMAQEFSLRGDFSSSDANFEATIKRLEAENQMLRSRLFSLRQNRQSSDKR